MQGTKGHRWRHRLFAWISCWTNNPVYTGWLQTLWSSCDVTVIFLRLNVSIIISAPLVYTYYQISLYTRWSNTARVFVVFIHYGDVIMGGIASQITSLTVVYSTVYSDADQRKHQSSASLAFVRGIHRGPVNSPHKWPVTRKTFPFDDVIMFKTYFTYLVTMKVVG